MLHFSRTATIAIFGSIVVAFFFLLPNFFHKTTVDTWPSWMPHQQVALGLDLQGGVSLLYQIEEEDYVQTRLQTLVGQVRAALGQSPRINYTGLGVQGDAVQVRISDSTQIETARARLQDLRSPLTSSVLSGGAVNEFDVSLDANGLARMTYSTAGLAERVRTLSTQSIEVIERRINALGTTEPNIQRQGTDRILVEVPGVDDPERLKDLIGQTAQLSFHLVEGQAIEMSQAAAATQPGTIVLPSSDDPTVGYVLDEEALVRGEDLINANTTLSQTTNVPEVVFTLNTSGAREFASVTTANVGRQFAIVLDDKVVSAPVIQEPITGGTGSINGGSAGFSVQEANDLAIVLRAGALPAKLTIVEQRTIGASLGADSIRAGVIAVIVATVFIATFMILCYGLLGFFSVLALIAQNIIMMAILTVLGATLTLPGIAGIVLTMALAVDANVLIYERMREEQKSGRSAIAALDHGFRRAIATIVDAHLTALIAAVALFWLGSGPIRGFAITLGIGILSTLFTAYLITRLIVSIWVRVRRPKVIPL